MKYVIVAALYVTAGVQAGMNYTAKLELACAKGVYVRSLVVTVGWPIFGFVTPTTDFTSRCEKTNVQN